MDPNADSVQRTGERDPWEHDVRRLAEHFPDVNMAIIERMVADTYAHLNALAELDGI
jgi:hypothetical protein